MIELLGTLKCSDLTQFQYFHNLSRPWLVAIFVGFLLIFTTGALQYSDVLFFCATGLWALGVIAIPYLNARRQYKAALYFREPLTYAFTPEAIGTVGTGISSTIAWSVLKKVRETESMFLLYHTAASATIVPKRFFQSSDEMERWRQLVAASVSAKLIEPPGLVGRWF